MSSPLYCQKSVTKQRPDCNSPLLQYANKKRKTGWFNDVTIGAGQNHFLVNRMVLSCYSEYFEEKFQVKEDRYNSVSIKDIDGESLTTVIDFIYSGEITIDQDNVMNILDAGHKLKIVDLEEFCFKFLDSAVNLENCFYLLHVANLYQNYSLKSKVIHLMSQSVDIIVQKPEFKDLSKEDLVDFILVVSCNKFGNMEFQYQAIITWTKHNEPNRKVYFFELFQLLNMDQLSDEFLVDEVYEEILVHQDPHCFEIVIDKIAQVVEKKQVVDNVSSIIAIGGWKTGSNVKEIHCLSGTTPKQYPDLPKNLDSLCSLKLDSNIFCMGGDSNGEFNATNEVWQMGLKESRLQWKKIASLNEKRCNMGAVIYQNTLVVVGGYDGNRFLGSTEIFSKNANQWKISASLNQARRNHTAVASEDCVYTLGGIHGTIVLSTVERLCGLDKNWANCQPMNSPRSSFAAVCCQNKIFAIGGQSALFFKSALNTVEMFDPSIEMWLEVNSMNFKRYGHSACVLNNKIFVVGGKNNEGQYVKEIECYDVGRDEWETVASTADEWHRHAVVLI